MPLIQLMVGSVVDYTRDVDPEVWHRLLTLVLDGLRAAPEARTPMPSAPLSGDDVARVMSNWCPRRA